MLKWLLNSEYYYINKYFNNSNENFVKNLKYTWYKIYKLYGRIDLYNL